MKYFASPSFWECYERLPIDIRNLADKNFEILKKNFLHPSLHFKKVDYYWSVRVGTRYRALSIEIETNLLWFWIGAHAEYDKLIEK